MNAKSVISTQELSKKVMSHSHLIQKVFFDLCYGINLLLLRFEHLSSSIIWSVMVVQSEGKKWITRDL